MNESTYDITILGSGMGGSLLAIALARQGRKVLVVERYRHPRFIIGEATSPYGNLALETLAREYDLSEIANLSTWKGLQENHPTLIVGLKRGFTFYFHRPDCRFPAPDLCPPRIRVAASPSDDLSDTNWLRESVDSYLVQCARDRGVTVLEDCPVSCLERRDGMTRLELNPSGSRHVVMSRFLVDATGTGTILENAGLLPPSRGALSLPTLTVFGHLDQSRRFDEAHPMGGGNLPYPADDAAVHHLLEEGWGWSLRFSTGQTSVGLVLDKRCLPDRGSFGKSVSEAKKLMSQVLDRYPSLREHVDSGEWIRGPFVIDELSRTRDTVVGDGRLLLPHAVGFIDPMFSTGMTATLLGVLRVASVLGQTNEPSRERLQAYENLTRTEQNVMRRFIEGAYASRQNPRIFRAWSTLYFAAASYGEMAWRLGKRGPWDGMLLSDSTDFMARFSRIEAALPAASAPGGDGPFEDLVRRELEPFNIAGLLEPARGADYPVRIEDLVENSAKLGYTADQMTRALEGLGLLEQLNP